MKLKLVVASMSILGLVSCPVFAADTTTTTSTTTTTKHKVHHAKHHRVSKHEAHESRAQEYAEHHRSEGRESKAYEYAEHHGRDMGPMPMPQPVPDVCAISQPLMILDTVTQNMGRAMPNPCNPGWFNRVQVSGGVNLDIGKWGNRNLGFMGENYQRFSINDIYINVGAAVNDWVRMFTSINYMTATTLPDNTTAFSGEYSAAYANNIQGTGSNLVQIEQAFATLGNFEVSPIYMQLGKQFQDFGRYEIHPITRSMTQVMSETLATSVKLGFIVPAGFNGSVYVFDDPIAKVGQSKKPTNYGAGLGYDAPSDCLGWDVGLGYLYNMMAVNDIAYAVQNFTGQQIPFVGFNGGNGYNNRVGGLAVYGDVNSGPFSLSARWTSALQDFNPLDLPENGVANVTPITTISRGGVVVPTAEGARPWAAGVQAGYGFETFGCRNNNIYVGYQTSREAAGLNLPRNRWLAGYGIEWWKNTDFGIEWDHDSDYSVSNGGNGNNTNLVSLRAGVKFG